MTALPDGWVHPPGTSYMVVPVDIEEVEGARLYVDPAAAYPVEWRGNDYTVAEAEELARRLVEAVAIARAGGAS